MAKIKYEVIRKDELAPGDMVIVNCPAKNMKTILESVELCFKGYDLRIIGVPNDTGIKLEFKGTAK